MIGRSLRRKEDERLITGRGRFIDDIAPPGLQHLTVVRAVHRGPYEQLGDSWGRLMTWMAEHGHQAAADLWESYLVGPESEPDATAFRTQLDRPLR